MNGKNHKKSPYERYLTASKLTSNSSELCRRASAGDGSEFCRHTVEQS